MVRTGIGYDVHRLVEGRPLILGGVNISYPLGLDGHSDADVLVHAVMDALLGAAAMGDIGRHFPDTDGQYQGISSLVLLGQVREMLSNKDFTISNIDAVIVCQEPRLAPYINRMVGNVADTLLIASGQVNVKATTTEGLGFAGSGRGIASYAVATITLR